MRLKRLLISSELFLQIFADGEHRPYRVVSNAVPGDAKVRLVRLVGADTIEVVIESESFPTIEQGGFGVPRFWTMLSDDPLEILEPRMETLA